MSQLFEDCFSSEANYLIHRGSLQNVYYIYMDQQVPDSSEGVHIIFFFLFSHAAPSMNICRKGRVNNHTSLPLAEPRRRLIPSTSPLTNSSSSAKPPARWVLLMNCLNPTTCSTCLMMSPWSISTLFCRQRSTTLMLPQQMSLQEFVSCGQNF